MKRVVPVPTVPWKTIIRSTFDFTKLKLQAGTLQYITVTFLQVFLGFFLFCLFVWFSFYTLILLEEKGERVDVN